jgi:hypothetical protein
MLQELLVKNEKSLTFQTMLLGNDDNQEVEVHEAAEVNFHKIQEHLKHGGSVFITSKPQQKLPLPTPKCKQAPRKRKAARKVTAFYFSHI